MFFNNATCDIYIGTGAGKKLMEDIESAKRSVKIVSPFLSPYLVKKLIDLHYKGIAVQLITTDSIEDFYGDRKQNSHELIQQEVHIDGEARYRRNKWKGIVQVLNWSIMILFLLMLFLAYSLNDYRVVWLLLPILLFFMIARLYRSKVKQQRIYYYTYRKLFPFKVVKSENENGLSSTYIHSKIYIVDDEIAYLGSLNYTRGGTKSNHETRIRLNDAPSVGKVVEEFDYLMCETNLPEVCVQEWGRRLYFEAVNPPSRSASADEKMWYNSPTPG
jgi:phosphatidylserine/phosphatidylglycerophosphate/cardiolipin synthase-like enzyme